MIARADFQMLIWANWESHSFFLELLLNERRSINTLMHSVSLICISKQMPCRLAYALCKCTASVACKVSVAAHISQIVECELGKDPEK